MAVQQPNLNTASWRVKGARPEPDSKTLEIWVDEWACASGNPPRGHIVPPDVRFTPDAVTIVVKTFPISRSLGANVASAGTYGFVDCPGAPPTAYNVRLRRRLGDRTLYDGGLFPPKQIGGRGRGEVRLPSSEGIKATSDLKAIAEASGWTIEEAKLQQKARRAVGRVSSAIYRQRRDIWIGAALSETPGGAPSLYVKGPAPQFVRDLVAEADYLIAIVDEQPYSFDELEERSIRVHQALVDAGYPNVSTETNVTGGGIVPSSVLQVAGLPADPVEILAFVPGDLRADVDLHVTIAPPRPSAEPDEWGPLAVLYQPGGFGPGMGLAPVTLRIGEKCVTVETGRGRHAMTVAWEGNHVDWRPKNRRIDFTDRKGKTVRLSDGDRIEGGGVSLWPPETSDGQERPTSTPEPGRRWGAWLDEAWLQEPDPSCPKRLFYMTDVTVKQGGE